MDLYNVVQKIPYIIMLGIGITIVLQLYVGGLNDLSAEAEFASEEEYRKTVVLENLLSANMSGDNVDSSYDERRAVFPIEIFTNENPSTEDKGFKRKNGHCYIEAVEGLDGENFGFTVSSVEDQHEGASNPELLECDDSVASSVRSPALVDRHGNPPLEVMVHVYTIE